MMWLKHPVVTVRSLGGGRAGVFPLGGPVGSRNEMGVKNAEDFSVFAVTEV